jgi:DNA-directed RNA polymerase subunit N (RpoN/RPB10)
MPRRNRRASATLSPVLIHFVSPSSYLSLKLQELLQREQAHGRLLLPPIAQRHPGPQKPAYGISTEEWPNVVRRVVENQEPLRKVADEYGVSHETIRRIVIAVRKQEKAG